jgi:CrcB protein
MEFANPFKGEPPDEFRADNSYRQSANNRTTVGFFMLIYLWLGLGGGFGTITRFWVNGVISRYFATFPMGTLAINVTGSFVIGFFATLTSPEGRWLVSPTVRTFFMVGICGGYTTFSSFSLQTLNLARDGEWFYAGINALSSFAFCLLAVWLGHILASLMNSIK